MVDIGASLFGGHKWVNSMHVVIGPLLSLIAYLAYELCFNNNFITFYLVILLIVPFFFPIVVFISHLNAFFC